MGEEPLVASTIPILVLLHFIVFVVPIKSLPLVSLTMLLMYLHVIWCEATSKKMQKKTSENKSHNADRERKLIHSALTVCSEIRHTIAGEIERLNKLRPQKSNCTDIDSSNMPPQKITPPKTAISNSPQHEQQSNDTGIKSPKLKRNKKFKLSNFPRRQRSNSDDSPPLNTRRQRSYSDDSPLKMCKTPEGKSKFKKLKRWNTRQIRLKRWSTTQKVCLFFRCFQRFILEREVVNGGARV